MAHQAIAALRALRNPACTKLAGLLNNAADLREQRFVFTQVDEEINGRGYTHSQCVLGGHAAGLRANKVALARNWPAAAEVLTARVGTKLVGEIATLLVQYGVPTEVAFAPLKVARQQREEARLWEVYCQGGREALLAETSPA